RMLARGQVVMEAPRYEMIQDTINHWAHHRGQMTVYLRLMGAKVPAIYGPPAEMTSSSCKGWLRLRVKRRKAESQGECRDGEKPCSEKRQKRAGRTLAFATEHHVQEETT